MCFYILTDNIWQLYFWIFSLKKCDGNEYNLVYVCVYFYLWLLDNNLYFAEMKMKMYLILMAEIIIRNPSFHLLN